MYHFLKWLVRWLIGHSFPTRIYGIKNVPEEGGALLVANHISVLDSYFISSFMKRIVTFMSKQEHFEGKGFVGWVTRLMVERGGAIPVDRESVGSRGRAAISMINKLKEGNLAGIHPEGTRGPGGAVYKADPGFVEIARRANVPVVPIYLAGTNRANPPGKFFPRFGRSIVMIIGEPFMLPKSSDDILAEVLHKKSKSAGFIGAIKKSIKKFREDISGETENERTARIVMEKIAALGGVPYIDISVEDAKKALSGK